MPRSIKGAVESKSYRAVITTTRTVDGVESVSTQYVGPYSTAGTARSQITREKIYESPTPRRRWDGAEVSTRIDGHVEVSDITWKPLE